MNYRLNQERFLESILYIETDRGSGTGFVFNPQGYAVTCAHVVENANEIFVRIGTHSDAIQKAHVISCDPQADIAIILIDGHGYYSATIDIENTATLGDEVIILGYPFGARVADDIMEMSVSFTRGYVSSSQTKDGITRVLLDAAAKAGNSGSPVLSRKTGKVIGILCGSMLHRSGKALVEEINYMRPIQVVVRKTKTATNAAALDTCTPSASSTRPPLSTSLTLICPFIKPG